MVRLTPLVICALACSSACGDGARGTPSPDGGSACPQPDGGSGSPQPDGGAGSPGTGLAVVNSDYASTSISLLDRATGQVRNGDCINSGSRPPRSTLPLSGDVVLPSQPQPGGLLLTIDRTNSALTWIDPSTCTPLRQLDVSTGFYSNPHDVIGISPTKAYVARYERNAAPTPDPTDHDEGDDLLIIDPSVPAITGRIDLASYAVAVAGTTIQSRADRALLIDGKLYVALSNLSADFQTAGHGRLLVIDPATDQVTGVVDIPGLENCSGLSYAAPTRTLVVACGGAFSDADQAAGSGIVYVDVGASPPVETHRQLATLFGGRPIAGYSGIASRGGLGFGVTFGELGGITDQLWVLDVASGYTSKLADASDAFTLGTVLVDPARERVYLTDANAAVPRVQIYEYANPAAPTREASINANPALGLPPREIEWY
jgi:hypothetical protein